MNQEIYSAIIKLLNTNTSGTSNAEKKRIACVIAEAIPEKKGVDKMNFGRNMSFIQGVENGNVYGHNTFHDQILENLEEKK